MIGLPIEHGLRSEDCSSFFERDEQLAAIRVGEFIKVILVQIVMFILVVVMGDPFFKTSDGVAPSGKEHVLDRDETLDSMSLYLEMYEVRNGESLSGC